MERCEKMKYYSVYRSNAKTCASTFEKRFDGSRLILETYVHTRVFTLAQSWTQMGRESPLSWPQSYITLKIHACIGIYTYIQVYIIILEVLINAFSQCLYIYCVLEIRSWPILLPKNVSSIPVSCISLQYIRNWLLCNFCKTEYIMYIYIYILAIRLKLLFALEISYKISH